MVLATIGLIKYWRSKDMARWTLGVVLGQCSRGTSYAVGSGDLLGRGGDLLNGCAQDSRGYNREATGRGSRILRPKPHVQIAVSLTHVLGDLEVFLV